LPYAMGNGHPAFFGWVNSPPALAGVLASLAAAAMNPSVVLGDHADVHLERTAVRWLAELVGYPHAPGGGLLTSGASAATIVCLAGARGRACDAAGHDVRGRGLAGGPRLVAYVPSEAHSCVSRALELLGFGRDCIRPVAPPGGRLDADALRGAIAADRAGGLTPALLVGSAGTVNTGAIDPLAEVAAAERLWFHVDGAYGAFGVLDPAIAARAVPRACPSSSAARAVSPLRSSSSRSQVEPGASKPAKWYVPAGRPHRQRKAYPGRR
jgi:aromatic-L-amino-acid/L-tryptophan decarboxylase